MNDPARAKAYFEDKLAFTLGPMELAQVTNDSSVRIVDVRSAAEFAKEHIPGSVNLPRERWSTLEGLAKDKVNVFLCYSIVCHLAARAAAEFSAKGFSVMELCGGFRAWKEHRLPTETSETSAGKSVESRAHA